MRWLVLVPVYSSIVPAVERALGRLEHSGVGVWRSEPGQSDLPRCRSQLLEQALGSGAERILWVDSDVEFVPADALRLLGSHHDFIAGAYPAKTEPRLCLDAGGQPLVIGEGGGLVEIQSSGFGFVALSRELSERVAASVPTVEEPAPFTGTTRWRPAFCPFIEEQPDGTHRYLGEDYAFCARARKLGATLWLDTRVRLVHWGLLPRRLEDFEHWNEPDARSIEIPAQGRGPEGAP